MELISNASAAAATAVPLRREGIVSLMKTVCFQTLRGADSIHRTAATFFFVFFSFISVYLFIFQTSRALIPRILDSILNRIIPHK